MNTNIKAVLFDLDGTLVDTETIAIGIAKDIFKEGGHDFTDINLREFAGRSIKYFLTEICTVYGIQDLSVDTMEQEFFDRYTKRVSEGIEFFPDVLPLLQKLREKSVQLGIVTGAKRELLLKIVEANNATEYFDVLIAIEDSGVSKPDPKGYLMAAEILGLSSEDCVVVEDAFAGIEAGREARMKVFALDREARIPLSESYERVETLEGLENKIVWKPYPGEILKK